MESTGLHVRDFISLSPSTVAGFPLQGNSNQTFTISRGSTLTFVARRVDLAGAVFDGYHVVVVADEVTGSGITLRQPASGPADVPGPGTVGREGPKGMNLTVLCRVLNASGSVTEGGQGGKGLKGPPRTDRPPDAGTGNDGKPLEGERGFKGHLGLRGAPGGPGGDVLVQAVTDLRGGGSAWTRQFGPGGFGGDGGEGGPGGSGAPPGRRGVDGDPGPRGVVRPPVAVKTGGILASAFVTRLDQLNIRPQWTSFRVRMADQRARSVEYGSAVTELDAAQAIAPDPSITRAIRKRLQNFVTANGLERDLGLVPDIDVYSARGRSARRKLGNALFVPGGSESPLASMTPDTLHQVAGRLAAHLAEVMTATETLGQLEDDARTRDEQAEKAAADTVKLLDDVRRRLDEGSFNPASLTLPSGGPPISAATLRAELEALFIPSFASLLPAAVDLLVPVTIGRGSGTFQPDRPALQTLRSGALGLASHASWPAAGNPNAPKAIDLISIAADLRRATGDQALRDLIVELVETLHGQRLTVLRREQAGRVLASMPALRERCSVALSDLQQLAIPRAGVSSQAHGFRTATFLRALRVILDLLWWHIEQEHRALDLFTLGSNGVLIGTGPVDPFGPIQLNFPDASVNMFFDPGAEDDAHSHAKSPFVFHDLMLKQATEQKTTGSFGSYFSRGFGFTDSDAASKTLTFVPGHPAFTRFVEQGVLWFDVSVADLAGSNGSGPHAEIKVVGARVRLTGVTSRDSTPVKPFTMQVSHSGIAEQKDLNGRLHRQIALPALIDVEVKPKVDGELPPPNVPILCQGATLVDDLVPDDASDPGVQIVQPLQFGAYGRGAAAGWSLQYRGSGNPSFDSITAIEVDVVYTGLVPTNRATLRSVRMAGAVLDEDNEAEGAVTLTAAAPAGGFRVDLRASDPAVLAMPASVVVPAGATSTAFGFRALKAAGIIPPTVFATGQDGMGRRSLLPVRKPTAATRSSARMVPAPGGIGALLVTQGRNGKVNGPVLIVATHPPRPADGKPFLPGKLQIRGLDMTGTASIATGPEPRSLAADPTRRRLYVIDGKVTAFDLETLAKVGESAPHFGLTDVAVDTKAGLVYASQRVGARIEVFDSNMNPVVQLTDNQGRLNFPHKIAIDESRRIIYVLCLPTVDSGAQASVTRIVRSVSGSHTVSGTFDVAPARLVPQDIAVDPVSNRIYIANQGNVGAGPPSLTILRGTSLSNPRTVPLRSPARAVAARPGTDLAYVATQQGLVVVNAQESLAGPLIRTDKTVFTVAVDPDTGAGYLGDMQDGTVTKLVQPGELPLVRWQ